MIELKEEWRDIEGYEGLYQISNNGVIRSLGRYVNNNGGLEYREGKILKQYKNNYRRGYLQVHLSKDGKVKTFKVHRLVAQTFIPNPDNKPHIDHIDTDTSNNRVENLRWVTRNENMNNPLTKNKIRNKKMKPVLQYSLDGTFVKEWDCAFDVEKELNINHTNIGNCCKGIYKTAKGFIWKYKDVNDCKLCA